MNDASSFSFDAPDRLWIEAQMRVKKNGGLTSSLVPAFNDKIINVIVLYKSGRKINLVPEKKKQPTRYSFSFPDGDGFIPCPLVISSFQKESINPHSPGYPDRAMIKTLVAAVVNEMKSATKHGNQPNWKGTARNIIEQARKRNEFTVENKKELDDLISNVRTQASTRINSKPKPKICGGTSLALDDHVPRK